MNRLIQKIDETGTSSRTTRESVQTARTLANIAHVSELICSQDDDPGTSKSGGYLQQLVYRQIIRSIEHLKEVIVNRWSDISQQFIDGAIDRWSRRIAVVVAAARGRHNTHLIRKDCNILSLK